MLIFTGSFDVTALSRHLQSVCEALGHMKDESRHHLRFKVKEILDRLVRKFGYVNCSFVSLIDKFYIS